MNAVVVLSDVVSIIAFFIAAALALFSDFETPLVTRSVRYVFAAAMGLYVFVGFSNVLEHAGITSALDLYEDFAEILFVPALAYVVSTMFQNQQLAFQANSARLMRQQNDLLLNIVDTVPGGILVVGPTGAVTFANEGAERLLSMTSDSGGSVRITPSWTLFDPMTAVETTLSQIASGGAFSRRTLFARWPDGTQTELVFSSTPMSAHSGELGGSVVAFEAASRRS
jgi:PAS domain-containing protein